MLTTTKDERPPPTPSAAAAVADANDLLMQILLRLPTKPLGRAKSVSKRCLSLISSIDSSRFKNLKSPSGLFLHRSNDISYGRSPNEFPKPYFIPIHDGCGGGGGENQASDDPLIALTFFNENPDFYILHSCNGLLCCCDSKMRNYFVVNPTTKQFRNLNIVVPDTEDPDMKRSGVFLAVDPSESTRYKVVCVRVRNPGSSTRVQYAKIEIYSSESSTWSRYGDGDAFTAPSDVQFHRGVFWNGAINWHSTRGDSLYFHVKKKNLQSMPMPPVSGRHYRRVRYFGESGDHLHLVEFHNLQPNLEFKIYEMERDYSGWFVRYSVALNEVIDAYPEMIRAADGEFMACISCVLRKENDDESCLVLYIPGKVISYNLKGRTFKQICDLTPSSLGIENSNRELEFGWFNVYPYFRETLAV